MQQGVYDDPAFLARYREMRRFKAGPLHRGFEWPTFRALFPPLQNADVLDLGCGGGDLCRYSRAEGARSAFGIDLSQEMISWAERETHDPAIQYEVTSLETFAAPADAYDFVVSSLALHYVIAFDRLCQAVASALRPGGLFVFSCEHPIATAGTERGWVQLATNPEKLWTVDYYGMEGPRSARWLGSDIVKQHRSVAGYVNPILDAGLVLRRLEEPKPSIEVLQEFPDLSGDARRPPFLLIQAEKPGRR